MEMNTRLQVEHPVTEAITGFDLVEWQLRVAAGETLPVSQNDIRFAGHAVEARLYAEEPARGFLPSPGRISTLDWPPLGDGLRIDAGYRQGDAVATDYDAMLAKVIAHGPDRAAALARLARALDELALVGPGTNQAFLAQALRHPAFLSGDIDTGFIDRHLDQLVRPKAPDAAVLSAAARFILGQRAAEAARAARASADPHSPWRAVDRWRANLDERETMRFHHGEAVLAVAVDPDGTPDAGLRCVADGGDIVVLDRADQVRLTLVRPIAEAAAHEASAGTLTAPMPGRIVRVLVGVGDPVARGQTLMLLEAMKMEHAIAAPADGRVVAVAFAAGDQVGEGAELLRIDGEKG
jgi:3-methylcrotonyl-CoA carboxylase alpha subunit